MRPFELAVPRLLSIFCRIGVVVTPDTTRAWAESARNLRRVAVLRSKHDEIGENRREALALAMSEDVEAIQYTDLDRIIHWAFTRPSELSEVATLASQRQYTVIGRSYAAFASHPLAQRLPEMATNGAISTLLGKDVDVTSGCCAMSRDTSQQIIEMSEAQGVATDGEWPILAALILGRDVEVVSVDGLDFETPDYYAPEIQLAGGIENWLRSRYENLSAWEARISAANATIKMAAVVATRHSEVARH